MPDRRVLARSRLSAEERELRSRLARLVSSFGFVRGNISVRQKKCGRPSCHCATGGGHRSIYLVASGDGKLSQLYIPTSLEATTSEWADTYRQIRELLEELSKLQHRKLQRRKP